MSDFAAFVAQTAARPWEWGRMDCAMWLAQWCVWRWRVNPLLAWQDRYTTEAEAESIISDEGGLVALLRRQMTFAVEKARPDDGDVGVIVVSGQPTCAIRAGDKWAFRTPAGIGMVPATALAVWGD